MRDLTTEELNQVSGGLSLTLNKPLATIPVFSLTFDETTKVGSITFNGMTQPIGLGFPPVILP